MFPSTRLVVIWLIVSQLTFAFLVGAYSGHQSLRRSRNSSNCFEDAYQREPLPPIDSFPYPKSSGRHIRRRKSQNVARNYNYNVCGSTYFGENIPFHAAVGFKVRKGTIDKKFWSKLRGCNGVLLGRRTVLVTQSCMNSYNPNYSKLYVVASADNKYIWWKPRVRRYGYLCPNPNFRQTDTGYEHNYGVIILSSRIMFNEHIRPVCLAKNQMINSTCYMGQLADNRIKYSVKINQWNKPEQCDSCVNDPDNSVCTKEINMMHPRRKGVTVCQRVDDSGKNIWYATGVYSHDCKRQSVFVDIARENENIRKLAYDCARQFQGMIDQDIFADDPHSPIDDEKPVKPTPKPTETSTTSSTTSKPSSTTSSTTTQKPSTSTTLIPSTSTSSTTLRPSNATSSTTRRPIDLTSSTTLTPSNSTSSTSVKPTSSTTTSKPTTGGPQASSTSRPSSSSTSTVKPGAQSTSTTVKPDDADDEDDQDEPDTEGEESEEEEDEKYYSPGDGTTYVDNEQSDAEED